MTSSRRQAVTSRWPVHDDEQIEAAVRVLRSGKTNYWTGGEGRAFESEFAGQMGMPHAIALANGTVALELAMVACDIGAGDEVVVPAAGFIASATSVLLRGAVPVFADVDPRTATISAATAAACITPRTRAIVAVHLYGCPCPMDALQALADRHDLAIIEDCAQAHGARLHGRLVGSFGDAAAFSFCQDKIMSTGGEGGMLLLRDADAWERAWSYKDHGKNRARATAAPGPAYRWLHDRPGTNWRMTEVQAAIGRIQLRRLEAWVTRRRQLAALLGEALAAAPGLELPHAAAGAEPAWYRYPLRLRAAATADIVAALTRRGVPSTAGSCPELYREPALTAWAPPARLPAARELAANGFCLKLYQTMTNAEAQWMAATLRALVEDG